MDIPNIAYLASSLTVGSGFLFCFCYCIYHSQKRGILLCYVRDSRCPQKFSHAVFSSTHPWFPKTSSKVVSGPFPNHMWLGQCMQTEGWHWVQLYGQLCTVFLWQCPITSLPLFLWTSLEGRGRCADCLCGGCTQAIVNHSEKLIVHCWTLYWGGFLAQSVAGALKWQVPQLQLSQCPPGKEAAVQVIGTCTIFLNPKEGCSPEPCYAVCQASN